MSSGVLIGLRHGSRVYDPIVFIGPYHRQIMLSQQTDTLDHTSILLCITLCPEPCDYLLYTILPSTLYTLDIPLDSSLCGLIHSPHIILITIYRSSRGIDDPLTRGCDCQWSTLSCRIIYLKPELHTRSKGRMTLTWAEVRACLSQRVAILQGRCKTWEIYNSVWGDIWHSL